MKTYKLESVKKTGDIDVFTFSPIDGNPLEFVPGQFVMIYLGELKRAYSIACSPSSANLVFGIKLINGQFTSELRKLKVGDWVDMDGPHGHFGYKNQKKCIFVAGGSAITPFIGILEYINENKIEGDFKLFYSSKEQEDICFPEFLNGLSSNKKIQCVLTLTREDSKNWKGEHGRINGEMIKKYVKNPAEYTWYVCGPTKMLQDIKAIAKSFGAIDIKIEGWG
ncbi:MAG TPA: FAD-dependent oxidoreductase [Candidatus Bilamarchaeaceae archaeon]|nr:FAD-dependent oxidoreductase [Candidatus Bilamarchaeaceae archaeon]